MKNLLKNLFYFLIFIPLAAQAQESFASYSQQISTKDYEGHHFKLQANIRAEIEDDSALVGLLVRIDKHKGFGFMQEILVRKSDWKPYTIEGKIDTDSYQLIIGIFCAFNGKFFIDDLILTIEMGKDSWKTVYTADFEDNKNSFTEGIESNGIRWGINNLYKADIQTGQAATGNKCLVIEGKNIPNYGYNNKVGKYTDVNGVKLYYETYGEGQPLVILHTTNGSINDATPFIPEFAKKYKVILFDNRGHGKSSDTNEDLTYDNMAEDIAMALDKMGIDSALFWGFSDGAIQGLILAMKHPHLVKKFLAGVPNVQCDSSAIYPIILKTLAKESKDTSIDFKVRKTYKLMLTQPNIPFEKLSAVQCPVLVIAGDRDWVKTEHTVKVFQSIPNSQLCIIPGATHRSAWSNQKLFLLIADKFFEKPFSMPNSLDGF